MNARFQTIFVDLLNLKGKLEPKFIEVNFVFQRILAIDLIGHNSRVSIPKEYQ